MNENYRKPEDVTEKELRFLGYYRYINKWTYFLNYIRVRDIDFFDLTEEKMRNNPINETVRAFINMVMFMQEYLKQGDSVHMLATMKENAELSYELREYKEKLQNGEEEYERLAQENNALKSKLGAYLLSAESSASVLNKISSFQKQLTSFQKDIENSINVISRENADANEADKNNSFLKCKKKFEKAERERAEFVKAFEENDKSLQFGNLKGIRVSGKVIPIHDVLSIHMEAGDVTIKIKNSCAFEKMAGVTFIDSGFYDIEFIYQNE